MQGNSMKENTKQGHQAGRIKLTVQPRNHLEPLGDSSDIRPDGNRQSIAVNRSLSIDGKKLFDAGE